MLLPYYLSQRFMCTINSYNSNNNNGSVVVISRLYDKLPINQHNDTNDSLTARENAQICHR